MRFTCQTGQQTGIGRTDLNVRVCLGHQHSDRVNRSVSKKDRKRREPRNKPQRGQSYRYADKILLRDAHFQKFVGMGHGKFIGLGRISQIGVQNKHVRIRFAQGDQGISKNIS